MQCYTSTLKYSFCVFYYFIIIIVAFCYCFIISLCCTQVSEPEAHATVINLGCSSCHSWAQPRLLQPSSLAVVVPCQLQTPSHVTAALRLIWPIAWIFRAINRKNPTDRVGGGWWWGGGVAWRSLGFNWIRRISQPQNPSDLTPQKYCGGDRLDSIESAGSSQENTNPRDLTLNFFCSGDRLECYLPWKIAWFQLNPPDLPPKHFL